MQRTKSLQGSTGSASVQPPRRPHTSDQPLTPLNFDPQLPDIGDPFSEFTFPLPGDGDDVLFRSPGSPMTSFLSFPETASNHDTDGKENGDPFEGTPIPPIAPLYPTSHHTADSSPCSSPIKGPLSSRAMSVSSLNLDANIDASIEETGVSLDDIATFIEGPDPEDNKWVCTYDGCNRRFGRKENIKSHVQTHLGDRQFKCNHCSKCFVRGHDLKRHAKIHTGVKPYPCDCGNSFARHDALTRHKQRGMCTGAFEGAVRRVKKGRPRKTKHKGDERRDKPSRLRRRRSKPPVSTTPQLPSETLASPLSESFDATSITSSPAKDMELFSSDSIGLPPDVFTFTPPASPSHSSSHMASPTRSYRPTLARDGEFPCLSPTKRALDNIPEETPELPPIKAESPTPTKTGNGLYAPPQVLWPTAAGSALADDSDRKEFDIFTNHGSFSTSNYDGLSSFEAPSSTPGISDSNISEYDDDIFFNTLQDDNAVIDHEFLAATLPRALDDPRQGSFDQYQAEVSTGAI